MRSDPSIEATSTGDLRRRGFLGLPAALLLQPVAVNAQPRRPHRIGYIQTATPEEQASLTQAFDEGLRELGYIEGQNVLVMRRFAYGKQELLPGLASELVGLDVDVIVTGGNPVVDAVRRATSTIPVVMGASRDPVGAGFIASLARPGGNITGLTNDTGLEIVGKYVEILKELVSRLARIALLLNPIPPGAANYRAAVESAATSAGLAVQVVEARGRDQFEAAFGAMARERAEGVVVQSDPIFFTARRQLVELAAKHRLPAVYHASEFVESGGLVSYGGSLHYQFRRAATYVDKILKGAKPADLPVEQSAKLELVINRGGQGAGHLHPAEAAHAR